MRDPSTLEKIYEIPSFGFRPHDICFLDSDTIAVTNHGEKEILSNISFISFSQKKLINKIKIERTWGEMGHIIPVSKEEVFVSSVLPEIPRSKEVDLLEKLAEENSEKGTEARVKLRNMVQWLPAPMYRVQKNGSFKRLWLEQEKNLFKNNFSICAISRENEIYASAHSRSHNMIIWKKWQPYKIIRFNDTWHPAAVACSNDGAELMAASSGGTVKFFSTENYEEIKEKALRLGSGPVHILSLK